jgi:hypothetical protein
MVFVHAANSVFFYNGPSHGKPSRVQHSISNKTPDCTPSASANSDFGWYQMRDQSDKSVTHKCKARAPFRVLGLQSGASLHWNFRMLSRDDQHASGQRIPATLSRLCGVLTICWKDRIESHPFQSNTAAVFHCRSADFSNEWPSGRAQFRISRHRSALDASDPSAAARRCFPVGIHSAHGQLSFFDCSSGRIMLISNLSIQTKKISLI